MVQQQPSRTARIMVVPSSLFVWGDVGIFQPGFMAVYPDVCFRQADLAGPDRFYLASLKGNPGFITFQEEELMIGLAVRCDDFDVRFHLRYSVIVA